VRYSNFLSGLRVLDLSQFVPGPYATQILADMGADVLKVEPPTRDPLLDLSADCSSGGVGDLYELLNAGKRIVCIDLKSSDGRAAFSEFVRKTDVLLESYRPGVMERLGLAYHAVKEINPSTVYCSLSGYGQTGPYQHRAGHDINYLAMTGALSAMGPSSKPSPAFPPMSDYGGALQAASSILGALFHRERTGRGTFIDIAMADTVLAWQAYGLANMISSENKCGKKNNRESWLLNGGAACYNIYKTLDEQFIAIGAIEHKFWKNFCNAIEKPGWILRQNERKPQKLLISDVATVISRKSMSDWDLVLSKVDCCYHPVLGFGDILHLGQIRERKVVCSEGKKIEMRSPVWIDETPPLERSSVKKVSIEEAMMNWKG